MSDPTGPSRPRPGLSACPIDRASRLMLAVVALAAGLWVLRAGQAMLLPVAVALFLAGVLAPAQRLLGRAGLADWLAAVVLITLLTIWVGLAVWFFAEPAVAWLEGLPDLVRQVQRGLGPLSAVLERMLGISPEAPGDDAAAAGRQLAALVLRRAQPVGAGLVVVAVLLFFLMAEGRKSIDKVSRALPQDRTEIWQRVVGAIGRDVMRYLQVVALVSVGLGLTTWLALWALGMPNPGLWGAVAGATNLVPYLGPAVTLVALLATAAMTFNDSLMIVLPAVAFYVLTVVEGQIVMPLAVGRHMALNPLAVLVAILVWSWAWGILGTFLAVPLTASLKVVLEETGHLPTLRAALS